MLFDVGDADFELEAFVDFVLLEFGELGVEAIDFCVELVDAGVQAGDVVLEAKDVLLGCHVLHDVAEHLSQFVGGGFLGDHIGNQTPTVGACKGGM
jgi:hypothetical protein